MGAGRQKKRAAAGEEAPASEAAAMEPPKRKRRAAKAEAAAPAEAEAAEEPTAPKAKKRAKKAAAAAEGGAAAEAASPEERRRAAQREMQQMVVRLRQEGKSEAEIKAAKQELKGKQGQLRKPDCHRELKKKAWLEWLNTEPAQDKVQAERTEKLQRQHDLVVIPVVWRGRHDKVDVLKAAEDVKACVAQQGVDVWVDSRRQYTPGQKFAHWEHRGVMLRVEVGPDDVKEGVCRVAKAKEPGDYKSVERKRVRLPPAGARALLVTLKEWGLAKIKIERREGDDDEEVGADADAATPKGAKSQKMASKAVATAGTDEDDVTGNWAPHVSPSEAKKDRKAEKRNGQKKPKRKLGSGMRAGAASR